MGGMKGRDGGQLKQHDSFQGIASEPVDITQHENKNIETKAPFINALESYFSFFFLMSLRRTLYQMDLR